MEGGYESSPRESASCAGDHHPRISASSCDARYFEIGHKLSDPDSIRNAQPDGKVSLVLKSKSANSTFFSPRQVTSSMCVRSCTFTL